jgi:hypothetical protein
VNPWSLSDPTNHFRYWFLIDLRFPILRLFLLATFGYYAFDLNLLLLTPGKCNASCLLSFVAC